MVWERRGFDSVGCFDMMIRVLWFTNLIGLRRFSRRVPSVRHEIPCETSRRVVAMFQHLMNPLQRGTRNSFLSATEKSRERAMVNRSAIVNLQAGTKIMTGVTRLL